MIEALNETERAEALDGLDEWDYDDARDAMRNHLSGSQQRYRSLLRGPAE